MDKKLKKELLKAKYFQLRKQQRSYEIKKINEVNQRKD